MAANLIELFKNTLGDLLVSHASGSFGESAEGITSAIHSLVPSLMGSLIRKGRDDAGARNVMKYLADNNINGNIITNATGLLNNASETESLMASGSDILKYLLGDTINPMIDSISGGSGLKTSSASSLLKLTAPFVMATVARYIQEKSLDAAGLKNLLLGQREFVLNGLPQEMKKLLGLESILQTNNNNTSMDNSSTPSSPKSPMSKLLPWIVLLLAALGLFYFVQKGCGTSNETNEATPAPADTLQTATNSAPEDIATSPGASGTSLTYTLKDGTKLDLERTSFSAWMLDFLKGTAPGSTGYNAATPNCMPFDKVTFDLKTGALSASSEEQLHQLYTIMKAYPEVVISIEGHTDNTGDADQNKLISEQKAQKVKAWLEGKGIAADRLIASGWGGANPKASNDTEEGRRTNQRVEACIVKK